MSTAGTAIAALKPLQVVTTQIGVGSPVGPTYRINATSAHSLKIYVFSNTDGSHPFRPLADISPKSVVINGVTFHHVKIQRAPFDENGDHIPDAVITIRDRSEIGLTPSTTSLTVAGLTRPRSPFGGEAWSGTAPISVGGGGGLGGGGGTMQPFQAYVAISLSGSYTGQFINFYMTAYPDGKRGGPYRISPDGTLNFQTASGTGAHQFVLQIPAGSSFTIGPTGTLHYGLSPTNRPRYTLVYLGTGNNFNLVPA
jgi:hypothetical protein